MEPAAALLTVEDVTIRYRSVGRLVTAVERVGFSLNAGDRFVMLGPSGCGKSSLLKAVAGLLRPDRGAILLGGKPVVRPGPDRAMVFQEFDQLLPWKTVRDNVAFPLRVNGVGRGEALARADAQIHRVGLARFAELHPHQLSGGMKQRVAIARALAQEPAILLMDEPFAALDALTRRQMQDELMRLWDGTGLTLLFVTHSIEEAVRLGSRILLLSPHPGRVRDRITVPACQDDAAAAALARRIHDALFAQDGATAASPDPAPQERVRHAVG